MTDAATVTKVRVAQLPTEVGMRTFTDLVIKYRDEHYGSRYHGALSPADVEAERASFERKRRDAR
jgi:hypothetical protein